MQLEIMFVVRNKKEVRLKMPIIEENKPFKDRE